MTRFPFSELLSRADEETLQAILGRPAVRLLHLLDPGLATPSKLRQLVTRLSRPDELLLDQATRGLLVELLPANAAEELATHIGLAAEHDLYRSLLAMRIRSGSTQETRLLEFFGVVPPDTVVGSPPPVLTAVPAAYGLFPHQRTAARKVQEALKLEPAHVLLHMPTGSGKTRTAMNVITTHLNSLEPTVVMWLAHSEELCEQAACEFADAWGRLGNREMQLVRFWGHADLDPSDIKDGFLVAGLAKLYSAARRDINFIARLADKTSLVVMDEAHQAVAPTYRLILEAVFQKQPGTGVLGLTATPGRTWSDLDADEELARFFAKRKVTLEVAGYRNPVEYLIAEGYLARPVFRALNYSGGAKLSDRDVKELQDALDIPEHIVRRLAEDERRNLKIIRSVEDLSERHNRIIVFAATVAHARLIATVLSARGLEARALTANTGSRERAEIIHGFRMAGDERKVLVNYGVLTTGFDAPRTSAALIARPTMSLVLYFQMVGRATRGPKAGGSPEAEIVTVADTSLPGFGDIGEAFLNWEDVWE